MTRDIHRSIFTFSDDYPCYSRPIGVEQCKVGYIIQYKVYTCF